MPAVRAVGSRAAGRRPGLQAPIRPLVTVDRPGQHRQQDRCRDRHVGGTGIAHADETRARLARLYVHPPAGHTRPSAPARQPGHPAAQIRPAIGTDEGDGATEALDILASHLPAQLLQAILAEPCISGKVCPGRASWRPLLPPCRNSRRPSGMRHGRRCSTGWRSENDAGSLAGFLISGLQSPISETRTPPVNSPMVCWRLLATGPEFADHSWDQFARAAVPWCRSAFRRAVPPDLRP